MIKKSISLLLIVCYITIEGFAFSQPENQSAPPSSFADWGACPFECCTYREWTVLSSTTLYKDRTTSSPIMFRVRRGERVMGLTGVVITIKPGKALIKKATTLGEGSRKVHVGAGDILYLLHYQGEGYYKFWFQGKVYEEQMPSAPDQIIPNQSDPDNGHQYIHMISEPMTVWWVKVKNRQGLVGWSKQTEHFGNMDACG
jgi:hypothetical protein